MKVDFEKASFKDFEKIPDLDPYGWTSLIVKAIELVDEEPIWMEKLWQNINYLKTGRLSMGLNVGSTNSAIIPVKIGDVNLNTLICNMLLQMGIYSNQINYPAVSRRDARIRMSVTATHTKTQLDKVLNACDLVIKKTGLNIN